MEDVRTVNSDRHDHSHEKDEGEIDNDTLGLIWPLRIFQLLGVWQPNSVSKSLAWIYYVIILFVQLWFSVWIVYFAAKEYGIAVGVISGFESLIYFLLWALVPYIISARNASFINNTVDYAHKRKYKAFLWLSIAYTVAFFDFINSAN